MKTAKDIAAALAAQAQEVAAYLLPQGKRVGNEWCVGSLAGEPGDSLKVHLVGSKAGIWSDFASGEKGGDLLDLWRETTHQSMREAMVDAGRYCGMDMSAPVRETGKANYQRPEKPAGVGPVAGPAEQYLCETRGIDKDVLTRYRVLCDGKSVLFPFYDDAGELVFWKRLGLQRNEQGRKHITSAKDAQPILFGWQAIPDDARMVVVTEGEIDALSAAQAGFPALSVPHGAGNGAKNAWIDHDYDRLARFDDIYLCFDSDEPGVEAAKDVVARLGRHRCRLVSLPGKDANDVLLKHGVEALADAISKAEPTAPAELQQMSSHIDDARKRMFPTEEGDGSFDTPWAKSNENLRFRPGEVIILAGYNGSGKSQLAGHLTLQMLHQGRRACLASMEFVPAAVLVRLVSQITTMRNPSMAYFETAVSWLHDRLWSYAVSGSANVENMRESFEYAYRRHGCTWFVVDNLAKCGLAEDDYKGQKAFVDMLTDFARDLQVSVLLVHHARKGLSEYAPPGKMDVKGTGAITDMADTVLTIWRNKAKEEAEQAETPAEERKGMESADAPDSIVAVVKQRHGDWEGKITLWFDADSYQFLAGPLARPFAYVGYSNYGGEDGAY